MTWLAVLLFLLLILPGLVFTMLAERRRASPSLSTFREISNVIVWSTSFTGASLLTAVIIHVVAEPDWLPDLDLFAQDPSRYASQNYFVTFGSLLGIVGFATTLSGIPHLLFLYRNRMGLGRFIRSESAWQQVFVTEKPTECDRIYVRVKLDTGTTYTGTLISHSPDFENADREIVLGHPGLAVKPAHDGAQLSELPSGRWKRVVLHSSAIKSITVGYLRDTDESEGSNGAASGQ